MQLILYFHRAMSIIGHKIHFSISFHLQNKEKTKLFQLLLYAHGIKLNINYVAAVILLSILEVCK